MIKVICSYLFGWNLFFIQLQTFMRHDGICHAKFNQAAFKKKKVKKLEIQVWVIFNFFDDSLNPAPSTLLGFLSPVSKIRCWKEKKNCMCVFKLHKLTQVHIFQEFVEWQWSGAAGQWLCLWHGEVSRRGGKKPRGTVPLRCPFHCLCLVFVQTSSACADKTSKNKRTEYSLCFDWTDSYTMLNVSVQKNCTQESKNMHSRQIGDSKRHLGCDL